MISRCVRGPGAQRWRGGGGPGVFSPILFAAPCATAQARAAAPARWCRSSARQRAGAPSARRARPPRRRQTTSGGSDRHHHRGRQTRSPDRRWCRRPPVQPVKSAQPRRRAARENILDAGLYVLDKRAPTSQNTEPSLLRSTRPRTASDGVCGSSSARGQAARGGGASAAAQGPGRGDDRCDRDVGGGPA